jgi:AbrB family looped-hinge helix DNA binding protein
MSASTISEKHRTVIPKSVADAAGLKPNDQVEWRFEDGEIRGRKLVPQPEPRRVLAKLVRRGGRLVFEAKGFKIEPEAIGEAVAEERKSRC